MAFAALCGWLEDPVFQPLEETGAVPSQPLQDVTGQPAIMRPGFHQLHLPLWSLRNDRRAAGGRFIGGGLCFSTPGRNLLQPFGKLKCQQLAEQAAYADTGQKVPAPADGVLLSFIVSINGTIQCQFHEAGEGDGTAPADLPGD